MRAVARFVQATFKRKLEVQKGDNIMSRWIKNAAAIAVVAAVIAAAEAMLQAARRHIEKS